MSYFKDWFEVLTEWFEHHQREGSQIDPYIWYFWAFWLLLIVIAVFRVFKFRIGLDKEKKIWGDGSGTQKTAVVIVPIKGVTPSHTSDFFQSLLEQDYSKYRIIVTVETADDPAAEWLFDQFGISLSNPVWTAEKAESGFQSLQFVAAGKCKGQGQKVHNQLAAFELLTDEDDLIVFVDADIVCPPDWLARLTAPINRGTHDPATTYRWLVPKKFSLASKFASVINASVTTQGGNTRDNMPWGGSMAISRSTFDALDVPALFTGSLNDDLRLGKAAKKRKYKVGYVRGLVRPTEVDFNWFSFIEFARRQYLQVKVFAPILYFCGNVIMLIYFAGIALCIYFIATGHFLAWIPLLLATMVDQVRAWTRESIFRRLFGHDKDVYKRIASTGVIEHCMTPIYMGLHWLIMVSTWFMNKMEWGGIKYQVEGVNKTRVLGRKPSEILPNTASVGQLTLPAGALAGLAVAAGAKAFAPEPSVAEPEAQYQLPEIPEAPQPEIELAPEPVAEAIAEEPAVPTVSPTEPISPGEFDLAAEIQRASNEGITPPPPTAPEPVLEPEPVIEEAVFPPPPPPAIVEEEMAEPEVVVEEAPAPDIVEPVQEVEEVESGKLFEFIPAAAAAGATAVVAAAIPVVATREISAPGATEFFIAPKPLPEPTSEPLPTRVITAPGATEFVVPVVKTEPVVKPNLRLGKTIPKAEAIWQLLTEDNSKAAKNDFAASSNECSWVTDTK